MGRVLVRMDSGYLRRPLDTVFGAPANLAVLRALLQSPLGDTGRRIAGKGGIRPQAALEALTRLEGVGVVRRKPAGRAYLFELNHHHGLVRDVLLPLFRSEAAFRDRWRWELSSLLSDRVASGVIFGSMARGQEGVESDFDVCLVVRNDRERNGIHRAVSGIFERLEIEYGLRIAPIVFTSREFARGYRQGNGFFKTVVDEGDLFVGEPLEKVIRGKENGSHKGGSVRRGRLRRRRS